jgi:hypothetical protein
LQVYFDVTTEEVIERLWNSVIPFNPKFYLLLQKNPDLYGPFWIYTTLIFVLASAGSFSIFLKGQKDDGFFQQFVPLAATIVILLNLDLWNWFYPATCTCFLNEMLWIECFFHVSTMYLRI